MKKECDPTIIGETREERAKELNKNPYAIKKINDTLYDVWSQTGDGSYRVSLVGANWKCNCPDHIKNDVKCKHILALELRLRTKSPNISKPTTKRAWKEYNLAQTNEIENFDELLRQLVDVIPNEEKHPGAGRPRLAIQDQFFCSIQKVYSQLSSRRSQTLLDRAEDKVHIERSPHFNAVSKFLNREDEHLCSCSS
jgi:hypothetical protein